MDAGQLHITPAMTELSARLPRGLSILLTVPHRRITHASTALNCTRFRWWPAQVEWQNSVAEVLLHGVDPADLEEDHEEPEEGSPPSSRFPQQQVSGACPSMRVGLCAVRSLSLVLSPS
eukprot:COSAG05_NODE_5745_length_1099_cov_9.821369_2_plen_118_part_01